MWQGAPQDFRGRQSPAPSQNAEARGTSIAALNNENDLTLYWCGRWCEAEQSISVPIFQLLPKVFQFLPQHSSNLPRFLPRSMIFAPTRSRRNLPHFADWQTATTFPAVVALKSWDFFWMFLHGISKWHHKPKNFYMNSVNVAFAKGVATRGQGGGTEGISSLHIFKTLTLRLWRCMERIDLKWTSSPPKCSMSHPVVAPWRRPWSLLMIIQKYVKK